MVASAVLAAALVFPQVPAQAQDQNQIGALAEQLQQLREEFNELQRVVYGGEVPPTPAAAAEAEAKAAAAVGVADRVQAEQAAQFEIRLNVLEEEIRTLTGTLERIGFGVNQNRQRIERLAEDLEFRLQAIEQAVAAATPGAGGAADAGAGAAGVPAAPPVAGSPAPAAAAAAVPVAPGDDPGAAGAQVLGVLPAARPDEPGIEVAPVIPAEPEPTPEEQYELAYGLLLQFRTDEAEFAFTEFLDGHANHKLAGVAHYWLGELYYRESRFQEAAVTFFEGYQMDAGGPKAPDSLLRLGMSLAHLEQNVEACATLDEFRRLFPDAERELRNQAAAERSRLDCD